MEKKIKPKNSLKKIILNMLVPFIEGTNKKNRNQ